MGATGFIELAGISTIAAMLTLAPQGNAQDRGNQGKKATDEITVTGCLTANAGGNRFVLTPLKKDPLAAEMTKRTTDVVPTYTYELHGGNNLRAHANQQVSVTGLLDRKFEKDAEVDRDRETTATPATPDAPKPKVETEEKANVEVRRLQVKTVTSLGKPCEGSTN